INVARSSKWSFVMMAESLDGGAVTYRSNRHFDVLNENIVFPLKSAGNATQFKQIFEDRRNAYGQSLVLANTTSHDEENYSNIHHALLRYFVTNTMDGVPLVFMGQELGITRLSGFTFYETNFGKQVAHFKKFNSMQPAWLNRAASPFGEKFLFDAYAAAGQARRTSPALRSPNRYFLSRQVGGTKEEIWAVAKYEQANVSPNFQDVVFAFSNLRTEATGQSDTFSVNVTQGSSNLFGIKTGRTYNVRNLGAHLGPQAEGYPQNRRSGWLWGPGGRSGASVLSTGITVFLNGVPTSDAGWKGESFTDSGYSVGATGAGNQGFDWQDNDADVLHDPGETSEPFADANSNGRYDPPVPFEPQYLKLYDVTPPPHAGQPAAPQAYAIGSTATFSWSAANDPDGGISGYRLLIGTTPGGSDVLDANVGNVTAAGVTGTIGQTLYARVVSVNNAGIESPTASSESAPVKLLSPSGDEDGDSMRNDHEDLAGTNPLAQDSSLRMESIARAVGGGFTVEWQSVPGKVYRVQRSDDLDANNWTDISGDRPATEVTSYFTDTTATSGRKFYRVRLVTGT
ncbi:MAG: hypothetical protein ACOYMN_08795, partial [Roseimicrobium sp.]